MRLSAVLLLMLACLFATAQHFPLISSQSPADDFENIHVQKLSSDSLSTAFLIWVKKEVKAHLHAHHTESLYILDGIAWMTMDEDSFKIAPGDYILIPQGAVHSVQVLSSTPLKVLSTQSPEFHGDDRIFIDPIRRPSQKKD